MSTTLRILPAVIGASLLVFGMPGYLIATSFQLPFEAAYTLAEAAAAHNGPFALWLATLPLGFASLAFAAR